MNRSVLVLSVLLLSGALAGCADGKSKSPGQTAVPDSIENVQVTDTTGAIRGVVVDQKIAPIAGAVVTLRGLNGTQTSATDGGFVFTGLAAGDYFLTASKPGYQPTQSSASVVAGQDNPPITRILMAIDNATAPVVELQNWKAFLQCGVSAPMNQGSFNPCLFTGSDNVHYFTFGQGVTPDTGQAEAIWTGTQPLGNDLYLEFGGHGQVGQSPMSIRLDKGQLDKAASDSQIMVRVFAGDNNATVVVNQAYDIYVSYFYNFVPREDYRFATDGACDPITVCQ